MSGIWGAHRAEREVWRGACRGLGGRRAGCQRLGGVRKVVMECQGDVEGGYQGFLGVVLQGLFPP